MNRLRAWGVKLRDWAKKGHLVFRVCYNSLIEGSLLMRPSCFICKKHLHSQNLILLGDLNCLDVCWENKAAGCKQSRRLLECTQHNFLVQTVDRLTVGEAFLYLVLTDAEELIKEVKTGGTLGCSDHALLEFVVSGNKVLVRSRVGTLNFRKVNVRLFKNT